MHMACRHIKVNGLRCKSPALKGGQFCYYHSKTRTVEVDVKFGPLRLPTPEDPAAVQLSVARINQAILCGHLDLRKAESLFTGLRIAARFIDRKQVFDAAETVQSAEEHVDGDELAPLDYVCDDDEDCNECSYSELCPRCIHPGEEAEDEDD